MHSTFSMHQNSLLLRTNSMETNKGKYLHIYEVSPTLPVNVLKCIKHAEIRQSRLESAFSYSLITLATILCLGAFAWVYNDATQTGLWSSLSLIFSDGGVVVSYWREFTSSIIESLPVVSLVAVFISLFVLVLSIGNFTQVRQNKFSFNN